MKKLILAFWLLSTLCSAQILQQIITSKPPSVAASIAYTGQTCNSGNSASGHTCTATMNVSLNDTIVAGGNNGTASASLSSCSNTGTAAVTWAVVSSSVTATGNSDTEQIGMCLGKVTTAGTVNPVMNWSSAGVDDSIIAAAFSGSTTWTSDGSNSAISSVGSTTPDTGTFTTTVNGGMLVSVVADTQDNSAVVSAGTSSVTFQLLGSCITGWGGKTCMEYGLQSTAGAGTHTAWSFTQSKRWVVSGLAIKP